MESSGTPVQIGNDPNTGQDQTKTIALEKSPERKGRVNKKKLLVVSGILIFVWAIIVVSYYAFWDKNEENPSPLPEVVVPSVTVKPTITFSIHSDEYLDFEYPEDARVEINAGEVLHPYSAGRSITGVNYLKISRGQRFSLESIASLYGDEFTNVHYDEKTNIYSEVIFQDEKFDTVETELQALPEIKKLEKIDGYLVKLKEIDKILLMSLTDEGLYQSVNYGLWTDLDYMGAFAQQDKNSNFISLRCEIEIETDYDYCEDLITKFLGSVQKNFTENEQYKKPELEAVLELRDPTTAQLLGSYRFHLDDYEEGTYFNSTHNSFSINTPNAVLSFWMLETFPKERDISFADIRTTIPVPDIDSTIIFSNLLKGSERVSLGGNLEKSYDYLMYYSGVNKNLCYEALWQEEEGEYVGCSSYKLKFKDIDVVTRAGCRFDADTPDSWEVCDELIGKLKMEEVE